MISDKKGGMIDLLVIQVEIEVKTGERNCKLPYFRFTRITTHQKLEWQIMEIKFIAMFKLESLNSESTT